MSLRAPVRGLLGEKVRLLKGHFRRQRMHSARRGVVRDMRLCELVIAIVSAKLLDLSLAPCKNCRAIEMDIFRSRRLNGGWRRHRAHRSAHGFVHTIRPANASKDVHPAPGRIQSPRYAARVMVRIGFSAVCRFHGDTLAQAAGLSNSALDGIGIPFLDFISHRQASERLHRAYP